MENKDYDKLIENIETLKGTMTKTILQTMNLFSAINLKLDTVVQSVLNVTIHLTKYMEPLAEAIKALNSPDSWFSYENYKNALNGYHWTLPYNMSTEDLKILLSTVESEAEFDRYMVRHFSNEKIKSVFEYILEYIPKKHKTLVKQIQQGYDNKQYALINLGMMSIIDDLIARLLVNKGKNTNSGIMKPVVDYLGKLPILYFDSIFFSVLMLSNNIDFIFENIIFSDGYAESSNKKARRHLAVHGRKVSNKKTDSLMLINTIYTIILTKKILDVFINTLIINNKAYIIDPKKEELVDKRFTKMYEDMIKKL